MPAKHLTSGNAREPILKPVAITALRPTQITVGMREVHARRKHWRSEATGRKRTAFLEKHLIPVILGFHKQHFILDHHHLVLALHQEGLNEMYVTVIADLSALDEDTFWFVLDQRNWMHPFDHKGVRRSYAHIPESVEGLRDDPLRRSGGFAKDTTLYSEFLWADFLRRRMKKKLVEDNFAEAM